MHKVVPLTQFLSSPKCLYHPTKQCELHCTECDIPICIKCILSGKHVGHKALDLFDEFDCKREDLKKDLDELETSIYPSYQNAASTIAIQKNDQRQNSQKLRKALKKQGDILHKEIDVIIQRTLTYIDRMDAKLLSALEIQDDEINHKITDIKHVILDLKRLQDSTDVRLVSKYQSKNDKFRKVPSKLRVTLPNFLPHQINSDLLHKQLGTLTALCIETEEQDNTVPSPGAESTPPDRPLLDVPQLIAELNTGYTSLFHISCQSDEEIWTSGDNEILKLYNMKGELLESVETESGNLPRDIAMTQSRDLVYADSRDRSINLVSGTQIQTQIRLRGWRPQGLCGTSSGDLLVIMRSDDGKQTEVVRYSGSTEKQTIQWDDQGKPLYSSSPYNDIKYLSENRNLDICVADYGAGAVVVVSAAGKLRFRYTGPPSTPRESFYPRGITTDRQGNILTSDRI